MKSDRRSRTSHTSLEFKLHQHNNDPMPRLAGPAFILILARLVTSSLSIRTSAFQFVRASSSTSDSSLTSRDRLGSSTKSSTSLLLRMSSSSSAPWKPGDTEQAKEARALDIWPLDEYNAELLNAVHPRGYDKSVPEPHEVYDLIAIGAGAGGLVSSRQVRKKKKIIEREGMLVARLWMDVSVAPAWFPLCIPSVSLLTLTIMRSLSMYPSRLDVVPRVP